MSEIIGSISTWLWLALKFLGAMFIMGAVVVGVKRMKGVGKHGL